MKNGAEIEQKMAQNFLDAGNHNDIICIVLFWCGQA